MSTNSTLRKFISCRNYQQNTRNSQSTPSPPHPPPKKLSPSPPPSPPASAFAVLCALLDISSYLKMHDRRDDDISFEQNAGCLRPAWTVCSVRWRRRTLQGLAQVGVLLDQYTRRQRKKMGVCRGRGGVGGRGGPEERGWNWRRGRGVGRE